MNKKFSATLFIGLPYCDVIKVYKKEWGAMRTSETKIGQTTFCGNYYYPEDNRIVSDVNKFLEFNQLELNDVFIGKTLESVDGKNDIREIAWNRIEQLALEVCKLFKKIGCQVKPRFYILGTNSAVGKES